ncbi:MAG: hypothetical protein R3B13_36215 [Polyangiaceae bacterium]
MKIWMAALVCIGGLAVACGSDDSNGSNTPGGCQSNPTSCAADQTCWANAAGTTLECLPADSSKPEGSPCINTAGVATCGAGMFCFPNTSAPTTGTCSPFCQNGGCSNGGVCAQVQLIGTGIVVPVCSPGGGTGGAGGTGGGSGGSSGSSGSGGSSGAGTGGTAAAGGAPADAGAD